MSLNYTPNVPRDNGGAPLFNSPAPIPAKVTTSSENGTVSSTINLSANTTTLEIAAVNGPVTMKWITTGNTNASVITAAGTANFDHIIPAASFRRFTVPIEGTYQNPGSLVGVNTLNGLYQRVAYKSVGNASVMVTEY